MEDDGVKLLGLELELCVVSGVVVDDADKSWTDVSFFKEEEAVNDKIRQIQLQRNLDDRN